MHKLAYETTNKEEMQRKFREALLEESASRGYVAPRRAGRCSNWTEIRRRTVC